MRNEVEEALIEMVATANDIREWAPDIATILEDIAFLVKKIQTEPRPRNASQDGGMPPPMRDNHMAAVKQWVIDLESSECPF